MIEASTAIHPESRAIQERIADAALALINSQPRMPTCEQLAAVIGAHLPSPGGPTAVALSPEGEAFRKAAEWEIACVRASLGAAGDPAFEASGRVSWAAECVWARPAATLGDVAARMLVAAHVMDSVEGPCMSIDHNEMLRDSVRELLTAVERVTGIRRPGAHVDDTDGGICALLEQDFERVDVPEITDREWNDLSVDFLFACGMLRLDKPEWIRALRAIGDDGSQSLLDSWTGWRTRLRGVAGLLDMASARHIVAAALATVPDDRPTPN